MNSYELTERGKIIIAVVLVLLLFVLPAVFLAFRAWSRPAEPPDGLDSDASGGKPPTVVETIPPQISESPPPTGGGFSPPDISMPGNGEAGAKEPTQPPGPEPEPEQPSVDPSEGTLSIFFSPGIQDALAAEMSPMLKTFLNSPKNTPDSLIMVELPLLSSEDKEKTIGVIVSAFTLLGVPAQRLQFVEKHDKDITGHIPEEPEISTSLDTGTTPDSGYSNIPDSGLTRDLSDDPDNMTQARYKINMYFYIPEIK